MKTRVIVVVLASLLAMVLGLAAPEPSSAIAYRIIVVAFVIDLAAARCAALGILTLGPFSSSFDEPDFSPTCLTAVSLGGKPNTTTLLWSSESLALRWR